MISAILLAAGQSKRMGELKQLMPVGQSTIIERAVDNLLGSAVDETIVVLGYRADEVKKLIATRPVKLAINPDYEQGMSTSIIAGLRLVADYSQAVVIALGDQPFIDSQTLDCLLDEFDKHNKGIVVPTCQGRRGHPVIFDMKYRGQLLALRGDIGARQLVQDNPGDVLEVATDCEGILVDIDTVDCYYRHSGQSR